MCYELLEKTLASVLNCSSSWALCTPTFGNYRVFAGLNEQTFLPPLSRSPGLCFRITRSQDRHCPIFYLLASKKKVSSRKSFCATFHLDEKFSLLLYATVHFFLFCVSHMDNTLVLCKNCFLSTSHVSLVQDVAFEKRPVGVQVAMSSVWSALRNIDYCLQSPE